MGANAALHCAQVIENVSTIVAIEMMSAAQAIDFRLLEQPDLKQGKGTSEAMRKIRQILPFFPEDDFFQPALTDLVSALRAGEFCPNAN